LAGGSLTLLSGAYLSHTLVSSGVLTVGAGVIASDVTLTSGAVLYVSGAAGSGATVYGAFVNSGAVTSTVNRQSVITHDDNRGVNGGGGEYSDDTYDSGGTLILASGPPGGGGFSEANNFGIGGFLYVSAGASSYGDTVTSGGTAVIYSGGSAGGTDGADYAPLNSYDEVQSGGYLYASAGAVITSAQVDSGGVLDTSAGAGVTGTVLLSGGTIVVHGQGNLTGLAISGFAAGDQIDFAGLPAGSITSVSNVGNTLTVYTSGGSDVLNVSGVGALGEQLVSDGNGGTFYEVCFAEGTHIATPDGETVVEQLGIGDLVMTLAGARPVSWIGYRSVDVSTLKEPESGRLVRIRESAFDAGIPHRDLLITQEHCVFVDGKLMPARMLVNGRSIIIDRTINAYSYYHVELETHGILLSEGLTTESYLDTGNRSNFANSETPVLRPEFALNTGHKSWSDAAAPLVVDRAVVEPIWRMLETRAREMDLPLDAAPRARTHDPLLHLTTSAGLEIWPVRNQGGRYTFLLPAQADGLRLQSLSDRPSDTIGPFVDDRRCLGVLVGQMALWYGRKRNPVDAHLMATELEGWFGRGPEEPHRWTAGNAELPITTSDKPALLEIEILAAGPYLEKITSKNASKQKAKV
jgi:autotransporter passenger strand-loop-strand repeat protein